MIIFNKIEFQQFIEVQQNCFELREMKSHINEDKEEITRTIRIKPKHIQKD